jgi:hypothetical protein
MIITHDFNVFKLPLHHEVLPSRVRDVGLMISLTSTHARYLKHDIVVFCNSLDGRRLGILYQLYFEEEQINASYTDGLLL